MTDRSVMLTSKKYRLRTKVSDITMFLVGYNCEGVGKR